MIPSRILRFALVSLTLASSLLYVACDGDSNAVKEPPITGDSGTTPPPGTDGGPNPTDGGPNPTDGGPTDCFTNPKTHFEIINACTNAVKITKNPTLPKLLADGGLPPLP